MSGLVSCIFCSNCPHFHGALQLYENSSASKTLHSSSNAHLFFWKPVRLMIVSLYIEWSIVNNYSIFMTEGDFLFKNIIRGCPQAVAHNDFAIYSCWLRYLLFPNYSRIIVILIRYALSTDKNLCLALCTVQISLSTLRFWDIPE